MQCSAMLLGKAFCGVPTAVECVRISIRNHECYYARYYRRLTFLLRSLFLNVVWPTAYRSDYDRCEVIQSSTGVEAQEENTDTR